MLQRMYLITTTAKKPNKAYQPIVYDLRNNHLCSYMGKTEFHILRSITICQYFSSLTNHLMILSLEGNMKKNSIIY